MANKKTEEDDFGFVPNESDDFGFTPKGLPSINKPTDATVFQKSSAAVERALTTPIIGDQSAANILTTPQRGMRGLGVGAQALVEGAGPAEALQQASEAVQPGFQEGPDQQIGSFIGETVGAAPIAALGAGAGALPAMFTKQMAKLLFRSGLTEGAMSAIQQAEDRGDVEVLDVAMGTGLGMAVPIIGVTGSALKRFIQASGRDAVSATTTISREAAEQVIDNPMLLKKFKGTVDDITKKTVAIQNELKNYRVDIGKKLREARTEFGIGESFEDRVARYATGELKDKNVQEISKDFIDLQRGYKFVEELDPISRSVSGAKRVDISPEEQVRELYNLRNDLKYKIKPINFSQDGVPQYRYTPEVLEDYKSMYAMVNNKIDEIGETAPKKLGDSVKKLRDLDNAYHEAATIYDGLQKSLSTEGKATDTLLKISKGEKLPQILGLNSDKVKYLRELEKKLGIQILDPVKKSISAAELRNAKSSGFPLFPALSAINLPGQFFEAIGGPGTASILGAVRIASEVAGIPKVLASQARPATLAALQQANQKENQK